MTIASHMVSISRTKHTIAMDKEKCVHHCQSRSSEHCFRHGLYSPILIIALLWRKIPSQLTQIKRASLQTWFLSPVLNIALLWCKIPVIVNTDRVTIASHMVSISSTVHKIAVNKEKCFHHCKPRSSEICFRQGFYLLS